MKLSFACSLAITLLFLLLTIIFTGMFIRAANFSLDANLLNDASKNLMIAILDAETGQRGFIITGNEGYLSPYEAGITLAQSRLNDLKKAASNTSEQQNAETIDTLIHQKLSELAYVIQVRRSEGIEAANHQVETHLGKNLMDGIRENIDQIQLWADQRYNVYKDQTVIFGRIGFISLIGTFCFGFMCFHLKSLK